MTTRIIYAEGVNLTDTDHVRREPRKVFAVIGPFDGHLDKIELQDALLAVLRKHNARRADDEQRDKT